MYSINLEKSSIGFYLKDLKYLKITVNQAFEKALGSGKNKKLCRKVIFFILFAFYFFYF